MKDLSLIGLGVRFDLIGRELRPGNASAGGVTDHAREVTDEKDHPMPQVLEVFHFADENRVTQVQIGCRGVETDLDCQGFSAFPGSGELFTQLALVDEINRSPFEKSYLLIHRDELALGHRQRSLARGFCQYSMYSSLGSGRTEGISRPTAGGLSARER